MKQHLLAIRVGCGAVVTDVAGLEGRSDDTGCPGCGEALIRIAHGPQRYWVDFSGTRLLQLAATE